MPARVSWVVCALTLALIVGAVALGVPNHVAAGYQVYLVFVVSCALVGGLVASHRPANPVGWFLAGAPSALPCWSSPVSMPSTAS